MRRNQGGAGAYEQQRYDEGLRAWRRRVLPRLRWLTFPVFAASVLYALLGPVTKTQYVAGLVGGGMFAVYLWVRDEPPAHIQRHREGAEGERATEKALAPLGSEGWRIAHNVDTGRGNRDHVVVGPCGLFLLESKKLGGTISLDGDTVHVERVDDPRDSYALLRLAASLRRDAATLHDEILAATNINAWVTAVVVFWSPFDARIVEGDRIVFLHGDALAGWLRSQPHRLSGAIIANLARHIG